VPTLEKCPLCRNCERTFGCTLAFFKWNNVSVFRLFLQLLNPIHGLRDIVRKCHRDDKSNRFRGLVAAFSFSLSSGSRKSRTSDGGARIAIPDVFVGIETGARAPVVVTLTQAEIRPTFWSEVDGFMIREWRALKVFNLRS
jgi:hypothetical protein